MDWAGIWNSIVNFFKTNAWNILWFFVILVVGIIVIKILMYVLRKILSKTKMEKIAQQFICTIVKFVLWLVLILMLLSRIGVEITGILTACSAIILAVGMALQNAIANVANGIIIISSKMFKNGDYIITNGVEGKIVNINFMFTTLITNDNRKITLPNASIVNGEVTNLGAFPKRRVDFTFSVAYESDVEKVKKIVLDVMTSDGRVDLTPAPFCRLKTLNASSIDFFANCWCDNEDYWDVYYYIIETVYNEFKRNNISIPYNQLEIRERKDNVKMPVEGKGLQKRVEKVRKPETHHDLTTAFVEVFSGKNHKDKDEKKRLKKEEKARRKAEKANGSVAQQKENETAQVVMPVEENVENNAGKTAENKVENKAEKATKTTTSTARKTTKAGVKKTTNTGAKKTTKTATTAKKPTSSKKKVEKK